MEWGVPLSQVRDLLGHCGIVVTERYDRVRLDSLKVAVARLDDGQPFKILSSPTDQANPVESLSSTHRITCRGGGTGRRTGLKILGPARGVWVRFPPPALTSS